MGTEVGTWWGQPVNRSYTRLPDQARDCLGRVQVSLGQDVGVVVSHRRGRMAELLLANLGVNAGVPGERGR